MKTSAFPIVGPASQVQDYGLSARELVASIILSGMLGNAQEHVTPAECRCHVDFALMAADTMLQVTRG